MKYTNQSKKGGNVMKKILSVLMSFCTLFFMPIGKVNAEEIYNVLVICKDETVFNDFKKNVCKYCYDAEHRELEELKEISSDLTCIRRGIVKKYAKLNPIICCTDSETISEHDKQRIYSQLPENCQVLIIYDLSDSSLDKLIENRSMIASKDWRELLKIPTFLNDCINLCITDEEVKNTWFNSLNFITYDSKNSLSEKDYIDKFLKVSEYTVALERKFKIDNKWGRSHQNYLSADGAGSFLASLYGKISRFDSFKFELQTAEFERQTAEFERQTAEFEKYTGNACSENLGAIDQVKEAELERIEAEKKNLQLKSNHYQKTNHKKTDVLSCNETPLIEECTNKKSCFKKTKSKMISCVVFVATLGLFLIFTCVGAPVGNFFLN